MIGSKKKSRRHLARAEGGEGGKGGGDGGPQTPGRMTAVQIKHVGIPVLEFALDGVVERQETVLREMTPLVETNRARVGAKDVQKDGFARVMILGRQVIEEIIEKQRSDSLAPEGAKDAEAENVGDGRGERVGRR